jgi:hypothetical protein
MLDRQASAPELDNRDLLPGVQPMALDGHRHVVGVEPHRHIELEVRADFDAQRRRRVDGCSRAVFSSRTTRSGGTTSSPRRAMIGTSSGRRPDPAKPPP